MHLSWKRQWSWTPSLPQRTKIKLRGTSLVVQWLGVRLPMQGTRVQSLVWEDPTCHAWSNWAHGPRLLRLRSGACEPRLLSPHASAAGARAPRACAPQQKPQWDAHALQRRVPHARRTLWKLARNNEDPVQP